MTTPGVNRVGDMSLVTELEPDDAAKFRIATDSGIYYSLDREDVCFAIKELARGISKPNDEDWKDLMRCAR